MATLLLSGASANTPELSRIGSRLGIEVVTTARPEDELGAGRAPGVLIIAPETVADAVALCRRAVDEGWRTLWLQAQGEHDLARRMFEAGALDFLELPLDGPRVELRLLRAARSDAAALLQSRFDAQLIGDLSHDATNCQFGLSATLEVLAETTDAWTQERIPVLTGELSRLGGVVGDLLLLCRQLPPDPGGSSPSAATERAVLSSELLARELGVRIDRQLQPGPNVAASGRRLTEILQRLVEHGLRRCSAPGPLRVRTRQVSGPLGEEVELAVDDNGPALSAAEKIALSGSLAAGARGANLGLAVIRRAIERLGGSVSTAEPAGGGVAVIVRLPVS